MAKRQKPSYGQQKTRHKTKEILQKSGENSDAING